VTKSTKFGLPNFQRFIEQQLANGNKTIKFNEISTAAIDALQIKHAKESIANVIYECNEILGKSEDLNTGTTHNIKNDVEFNNPTKYAVFTNYTDSIKCPLLNVEIAAAISDGFLEKLPTKISINTETDNKNDNKDDGAKIKSIINSYLRQHKDFTTDENNVIHNYFMRLGRVLVYYYESILSLVRNPHRVFLEKNTYEKSELAAPLSKEHYEGFVEYFFSRIGIVPRGQNIEEQNVSDSDGDSESDRDNADNDNEKTNNDEPKNAAPQRAVAKPTAKKPVAKPTAKKPAKKATAKKIIMKLRKKLVPRKATSHDNKNISDRKFIDYAEILFLLPMIFYSNLNFSDAKELSTVLRQPREDIINKVKLFCKKININLDMHVLEDIARAIAVNIEISDNNITNLDSLFKDEKPLKICKFDAIASPVNFKVLMKASVDYDLTCVYVRKHFFLAFSQSRKISKKNFVINTNPKCRSELNSRHELYGTIYLLYKKQQTLVELFKQLMSPEDKVVTEPINPQFMFILPAICKNNDIDIEIRSELSSVLIPQPRLYPLITKTFQSLYNDFNIGLQDPVYQIINKIVKPKRKTVTAMEVSEKFKISFRGSCLYDNNLFANNSTHFIFMKVAKGQTVLLNENINVENFRLLSFYCSTSKQVVIFDRCMLYFYVASLNSFAQHLVKSFQFNVLIQEDSWLLFQCKTFATQLKNKLKN
jgi:hypothetical protein